MSAGEPHPPNWPEDDGSWRHDCDDFQPIPTDDTGFWTMYDHHPGRLLNELTRLKLYESYVRTHQDEFPDCPHKVFVLQSKMLHLALLDIRDVVVAHLPRWIRRA